MILWVRCVMLFVVVNTVVVLFVGFVFGVLALCAFLCVVGGCMVWCWYGRYCVSIVF